MNRKLSFTDVVVLLIVAFVLGSFLAVILYSPFVFSNVEYQERIPIKTFLNGHRLSNTLVVEFENNRFIECPDDYYQIIEKNPIRMTGTYFLYPTFSIQCDDWVPAGRIWLLEEAKYQEGKIFVPKQYAKHYEEYPAHWVGCKLVDETHYWKVGESPIRGSNLICVPKNFDYSIPEDVDSSMIDFVKW